MKVMSISVITNSVTIVNCRWIFYISFMMKAFQNYSVYSRIHFQIFFMHRKISFEIKKENTENFEGA